MPGTKKRGGLNRGMDGARRLMAGSNGTSGHEDALGAPRFWLIALFCNVPLISAFLGFTFAQVSKFFLDYLNYGRWDYTRLWGSGGMPSSHTAFVTGLCMSGENRTELHGRPCTTIPCTWPMRPCGPSSIASFKIDSFIVLPAQFALWRAPDRPPLQ